MARIGWIFGTVFLLLLMVIGATAVLGAFDAQTRRALLEDRLAGLGAGPAEINGPVVFQFLPRPRIEVRDVRFTGVARMDALAAELDFTALLRGRIEFAALRLRNLDVDLAALRGLPSVDEVPDLAVDRGTMRWTDGQGTPRLIEFAAFTLDHDVRAHQVAVAGQVAIGGGSLAATVSIGTAAAGQFPVVARGVWSGGAQLSVNGSLAPSDGGLRLVGRFEMQGRSGAAVYSALPPASFRADGQIELGRGQVIVNDVHFGFGDLGGTGAASYLDGATPRLDAAVQLNRLDVDALLARMPSMPEFAVPANLNADIDVGVAAAAWRGGVVQQVRLELDVAPGVLTVQRASALFPGGADASVAGRVTADGDGLRFDGHVVAGADNLRSVLEWAGADIGNLPGDRLRRAQISTEVVVVKDVVNLTSIDLRLDAARATGLAAIAVRPRPSFSLDLAVEQLNLDGYRLPGGLSSLGWLTDFDTNARLHADALTVGGAVARDVLLDLTLLGGKLALKQLSIGDYDGLRAGAGGSVRIAPSGAAIYDGMMTLSGQNMARSIEALGFDWPDTAPAGPFDVSATFAGDPRRLDFSVLQAKLGDGAIAGTASFRFGTSAAAPSAKREFDARLAVDERSLDWFDRLVAAWPALPADLLDVKVDLEVADPAGQVVRAVRSAGNGAQLVVERP